MFSSLTGGTEAALCHHVFVFLRGIYSSFISVPSLSILSASWMALITCYNYPNVDCKISLIENYNQDPYQYMSEQILTQGKMVNKMQKKKTFACLVRKHFKGKRSSLKQAATSNKSSPCKHANIRTRELTEYVAKMQSRLGKIAHVERELMQERKEVIMEEWKRFARVVDRSVHRLILILIFFQI